MVNSHNYKEPPMNQFEKLIEYIINEQEDKARELFHQIVVEKSRSIYENLIDEVSPHGESNGVDDLVDEISNDHLGMSEEEEDEGEMEMPSSDSDSGEGDDMGDMGGDDMGDMGGDDMGDEEGGEEDLSNRVMGLEAELDELQAKFDKIIAGEENEEDGEPGVHGDVSMHSMHGEAPGMDDSELMEYVIPVKDGHGAEKKGGSEGKLVGSTGTTPVNSKSLNQPKNNMGGTNKNIAQGGSEAAPEGKAYTKPNNAYSKGATENDIAKRNVNVPGGNGANKFFNKNETSYEKNHGKEGQTTDGSVPVAKGSVVAESRKVPRKTTR